MAHVAKEMQRQGFNIPLLIGGATTSRVHSAVKIAPHYAQPVIWVKDASRGVGVASNLLSTELRRDFVAKVQAEYDEVRARHAGKQATVRMLTLAEARANKAKIDWTAYNPPAPGKLGISTLRNYPLAEIARYIDWDRAFCTWGLHGR